MDFIMINISNKVELNFGNIFMRLKMFMIYDDFFRNKLKNQY